MQRLQQKFSPWIALGVTCFSLSVSSHLNSLMAVATKADSGANQQTAPNSVQSLNSMEQTVYEQINQHREAKGLPPLLLDGWLTQQAREHSQAMAKSDVLLEREVLQQVNEKIVNTEPYQSAATAVGMNLGYANPAQANINYWLRDVYGDNSTTINGEYELTGIGVAINFKGEYYFTQIFLRR